MGTVRTATGTRPIIGTVQLSNGQRASLDSLGRFAFDSVPAGQVIATARAVLFLADSARVTIRSGQTTRHDFVLPVDSLWVVKHEERWLGCAGAPVGVPCVRGRHVRSDLTDFPVGAWLFRDSAGFSTYWRAHATHHQDAANRLPVPALDWSRESMLVVSYGEFTGCGPRTYVNRVELRADTTVAVVGPDSLYEGPPRITCMAQVSSADFVVIPRPRGAVVVRPADAGSEFGALAVVCVSVEPEVRAGRRRRGLLVAR